MQNLIDFPTLKIEILKDEQLDQAAAFLHASWHLAYRHVLPQDLRAERTLEYFLHYISARRKTCWLAWMGNRLIGLATSSGNCIEDMWVSERFQRQGVGSRLVQVVLTHLVLQDYRYAQVGCEDFNQVAVGFFTKAGWRQIGAETVQINPNLHFEALVFSIELKTLPATHSITL
jgi:GNAT superfamily N-acetyltransferase